MGGESREYRLWREQRNITPWVVAKEKLEHHDAIRSGARKKKRRLELAGNYTELFNNRDVASIFKSTVDYYSNIGLVMRHVDTGDYMRIPICSRWNTRSHDWYKKRYWDIYDSVKGERKVTMLAIGYDQRHMYEFMEQSGWKGDFYGYLMGRISADIQAFLKRLRSHYKRKGWKWNYGGYAIEPYQESGLPHIHFYFKGGWIAPLEDIVHLWGWSKPQGIKITVRSGSQVAGYLSSYLKKAISCIKGNQVHLFYAYAYFLNIPLYRVAYGKRKQTEEKPESVKIQEDDIPIEERFQKGKWECLGTDRIYDEEWDGRFLPFGKEERISCQEWERRYFESKTEEERFAKKYGGLEEFEREED